MGRSPVPDYSELVLPDLGPRPQRALTHTTCVTSVRPKRLPRSQKEGTQPEARRLSKGFGAVLPRTTSSPTAVDQKPHDAGIATQANAPEGASAYFRIPTGKVVRPWFGRCSCLGWAAKRSEVSRLLSRSGRIVELSDLWPVFDGAPAWRGGGSAGARAHVCQRQLASDWAGKNPAWLPVDPGLFLSKKGGREKQPRGWRRTQRPTAVGDRFRCERDVGQCPQGEGRFPDAAVKRWGNPGQRSQKAGAG